MMKSVRGISLRRSGVGFAPKAATTVLAILLTAVGWSQAPYIATSQNYFCAGSGEAVSMYCNVLAFDPNTNVADWTFEWSPPGEVSDPASQSVTVSPTTTTTYSAVMTAPDGTIYEDDITITVYPVFSVVVDPSLEACSTIGEQLEASVTVSNPMNWSWEPAAGLSNASASNPQILAEITGVYTVTATISGLGGASCSASAQVQVTSIFPSMELGPDIVACSDETVVIDPGLPVNYTYDWTAGNGILPLLEVTQTGTYGVTVTSPEGCVNSDALTVTFTNGPSLVIPDSLTGCSDSGVIVDATPVDATTGPFTYQWSNGSNGASTVFYESATAWVQVTDAGGCTSEEELALYILPSPEFSFPTDTALCFEDFPEVVYQLAVPAGYAAYQWSGGSDDNTLVIDGPGVYSVTVTNELGCTSERNAMVIDFCSEPLLFVPTAFTPDGDGLNEVLRIEGRNLVQLDFQLFNRWGNLVWQADSIGDYWHGQGPAHTHYVQDDLFLWKAKYRHYTDPSGQLSPWFEASGSVRIIR